VKWAQEDVEIFHNLLNKQINTRQINAYRVNLTERVHLEDLGVCGRVILKWNGHVQRMEEGRLPKEVIK